MIKTQLLEHSPGERVGPRAPPTLRGASGVRVGCVKLRRWVHSPRIGVLWRSSCFDKKPPQLLAWKINNFQFSLLLFFFYYMSFGMNMLVMLKKRKRIFPFLFVFCFVVLVCFSFLCLGGPLLTTFIRTT